ncbi:hypothetical protein [Streptosporangium saharense]|uniref:hypothetical protein n=1 Tax=Streptosporangium saharense TaxID=1706840 RepID=UPI003421991E
MNRRSLAARLRLLAREKPTDITLELLHLAADLEPDRYWPRGETRPVTEQPVRPAPEPPAVTLPVEQPAQVPKTESVAPIRRGLFGIFGRRPS